MFDQTSLTDWIKPAFRSQNRNQCLLFLRTDFYVELKVFLSEILIQTIFNIKMDIKKIFRNSLFIVIGSIFLPPDHFTQNVRAFYFLKSPS